MALKNLDFTDQNTMMKAIGDSVKYISSKTDKHPEIAIILGSGLGELAGQIKNPDIIPYEDIPHFPKPTIAGHGGNLYIGELSGKIVAVMQGRNHYYEGYDTQTITFPVRVLNSLGADSIILTNACGAVNKDFTPGDLMIITDHLSFLCPSPLRGANLDEYGPRFVDMSKAYNPEYIELAEASAKELNMEIQKGVYGYWHGPTYETGAEIRAYITLGADVVGMSTVAETMVARHCGMKVLGLSCITNMACIYNDTGIDHNEVIDMGKIVADKFISLLKRVLEKI